MGAEVRVAETRWKSAGREFRHEPVFDKPGGGEMSGQDTRAARQESSHSMSRGGFSAATEKNQGVTMMFSNTAALSLSFAPLWVERPK